MNPKYAIESLLFISGEPVALKKIAKILTIPAEEVKKSVAELSLEYQGRGLKIIEKDDEIQMVTAPESAEIVGQFVKDDFEQELSRAALETLSIVAYRGPVSHPAIEEIRGVNSSFTLRNLLLRGLVERIENPKDKRSYLYKISFDFLKRLGLEKIENLSNYESLNKKLDAQSAAVAAAASSGAGDTPLDGTPEETPTVAPAALSEVPVAPDATPAINETP